MSVCVCNACVSVVNQGLHEALCGSDGEKGRRCEGLLLQRVLRMVVVESAHLNEHVL